MMPDLGKYTAYVLLAYGGTFAALGMFIAMSIYSHRRYTSRLKAMEMPANENK